MPVFKVVYIQAGNPASYVLHERVKNKMQGMLISVGPLDYLLIYLGVSIAMHAFPSRGDAGVIWEGMKEEDTPTWVKIIGYPVVGLIYLGSLGSFFWLDILYGIGVAIMVPKLVISMLG